MNSFLKLSLTIFILILFSSSINSQSSVAYFIQANKIKLPINNVGVLADVYLSEYPNQNQGTYEGGSIIFSGGFYMSGIGDSLWANGCLTASRISDYIAGAVNDSLNPLNKVYYVTAADPPFGLSWQVWSNAVTLGAPFYDGNGDNLYNPIDLNNNGVWDPNEDKPMLTGNVTAWCLFNDGKSPSLRRFTDVLPQKIEIAQTVFAFSNTEFKLDEVIFVKYNLTNKGNINQNNVYFSFAADTDIDPYSMNFVGTDSILQMIYTYVPNGTSGYFGDNAPAIANTLLLGPHEYIPGVTFTDINNNGIYDNGIDIPLDTAYKFIGAGLPFQSLPGAMNVEMSGTQYYMSNHYILLGAPKTKFELRNYLLSGFFNDGTPIDPCTFGNGSTLPNCSSINPKFIFSGDPETSSGWLCTVPRDVRIMANVGPFSLRPNETKEILCAFIAGRGSSNINSVTVMKNNSVEIKYAFVNNFPVQIGIKNNIDLLPNELTLYQNYPNPFNPSTKIKFSIPTIQTSLPTLSNKENNGWLISLKVYDILGKEVTTLINKEMAPGEYEIEFDGSSIPSGVYFYQLKFRDYIKTQKMILVR